MFLTPRQQQILKAVVEDYVSTAEPIGSRTLSKKFNFGISPATLRNEMADLEDEGLLKQPHTSAGRVPSDAGYRLFVDGLMERMRELTEPQRQVLESLELNARDLGDILQQTAKITAVLAHCTAIVRAPRLQVARVQYVQLIPFAEQEVMLVILTDHGAPQHQRVALASPLGTEELVMLTNFLNAHLRGQPLDQLTGQLLERLASEMAAYQVVLASLWERMQGAQASQERVYVSHASLLAQQPEFDSNLKLRDLLSLLEREQTLADLLALASDAGGTAQVRIGQENTLADLHDCSVVSATYSIGGQPVGTIGVLGPTRLEYARAVLTVESMAHHLSHTLTRLFGFRGP